MVDNIQYSDTDLNKLITFSSSTENSELVMRLVSGSVRKIRMYSQDLEPRIYNTIQFITALSRLTRQYRYFQILVLVKSSNQAIKNGHRLIEFARSFSSFIKIHNPSREYDSMQQNFIINDAGGYLYKYTIDRSDGNCNFYDPVKSRELKLWFDEAWDKSSSDPEFRRLYI